MERLLTDNHIQVENEETVVENSSQNVTENSVYMRRISLDGFDLRLHNLEERVITIETDVKEIKKMFTDFIEESRKSRKRKRDEDEEGDEETYESERWR